jgi:hypothetical protein
LEFRPVDRATIQRRAQSPHPGAAPAPWPVAKNAAASLGGRALLQSRDRVDGFDASFSGWGKEDSDLLVRLLHAGVRRKDGAFATGVLHLWHPEADRSRLADNEQRLAHVIESQRVRAERGMAGRP